MSYFRWKTEHSRSHCMTQEFPYRSKWYHQISDASSCILHINPLKLSLTSSTNIHVYIQIFVYILHITFSNASISTSTQMNEENHNHAFKLISRRIFHFHEDTKWWNAVTCAAHDKHDGNDGESYFYSDNCVCVSVCTFKFTSGSF